MYRILADDYRNDRAWRHLAGVLECLGLALAMNQGKQGEIEANLNAAMQVCVLACVTSVRI